MIKIYHNPRCSKSRQGLAILEKNGADFTIIKYLEEKITFEELSEIISLLDIKPLSLIRKGEQIWKDNFKGKELTDSEIINAMITYPKLIERPIVVNKNQAVIGRPPEDIFNIIQY